MLTPAVLPTAPPPLPPDDDYPLPTEDPAGSVLNFRVLLPILLCTATVFMLAYAGMHIGKRSECNPSRVLIPAQVYILMGRSQPS